MEVRIITRAVTYVVTEIFTPNQITTVAADHSPTILDIMFVAMEIFSENPVDAHLVVEAIITIINPNVVAVASCLVHRPDIIAVVPPCIACHRRFAARITSDQNLIHVTLAAVPQVSTTEEVICAATATYDQNLRAVHVVEQSTTIPLLMSVVSTTCC